MLVIIAAIIILIPISNLSKCYPVGVTSLLQGCRVEASTPPCSAWEDGGDPGGGPSTMARLPASPVPKSTVISMPVLSLEMVSHDLRFTSRFELDVSQWFHSRNGQRVCRLFAEVLWRIPHQNCFVKTFCAVQACDLIHRLPSRTAWV